mgnify:CR=1 FL=1
MKVLNFGGEVYQYSLYVSWLVSISWTFIFTLRFSNICKNMISLHFIGAKILLHEIPHPLTEFLI